MKTEKRVSIQAKGYIRFSTSIGGKPSFHTIDIDDVASISFSDDMTKIKTYHKQSENGNSIGTLNFTDLDFLNAIHEVKSRMSSSLCKAFCLYSMDDKDFI